MQPLVALAIQAVMALDIQVVKADSAIQAALATPAVLAIQAAQVIQVAQGLDIRAVPA